MAIAELRSPFRYRALNAPGYPGSRRVATRMGRLFTAKPNSARPVTGSQLSERQGRLCLVLEAAYFVLLTLIISSLISFTFRPPLPNPIPGARLILAYVGLVAALLFESWLFLAALDHKSFRTLGLWFYPGWGREWLTGFAVGGALISAVVLALFAAHLVRFAAGAHSGASLAVSLARASVFLFLAAMAEEVSFRGYPLQRLQEALGPFGAVAILSALFGLGHLQNPAATALSTVNTMLAGALMAIGYLRTRGLWLPIGLHFSWNFFMGALFSLPVSGIPISANLISARVAGPVWLTGGEYGPEGGVILTVLCLGAVAWLARSRAIGPTAPTPKGLE